MKRAVSKQFVIAALVLLSGACTMKDQGPPPLAGPSELGLSIDVTASPDVLPQDGGSQSLITVTVRDSNGAPVRNLSLRVGMQYGATPVDFGALSARTLVTDSQGRATLTYTAPPSAAAAPDTGATVSIVVTPVGTNYLNTIDRFVVIRLVPPGVVIPGDGLVARFTFAPSDPTDHQNVLFDASSSSSNPLSPITTYTWDFGDGRTATGRIAQHSYDQPGTYAVTLTVGDAYGRANSTVQTLTVAPGTGPVADIVFSPTEPVTGQPVHFTGAASTASPGRTISRYDWNFGDGSSASGVQVSHTYTTGGTYNVMLIVTDSAGRTATETVSVTVGTDTPTADFTFSPTSPAAGTSVNFNGSASRAISGRTITTYAWDFGDGSSATGPQVNHAFAVAGAYNVILTVTDSAGQRATVTKSVQVR